MSLGNSGGILARLVERWQLGGILRLSSGQPLTTTASTSSFTDVTNNTPNVPNVQIHRLVVRLLEMGEGRLQPSCLRKPRFLPGR
jgi:hypothetical protein